MYRGQITTDEVEASFVPAGRQSADQRVREATLKNTWRHTLRRAQLETHTHGPVQ